MDSFNPLFAMEDTATTIAYEQRIAELESQVQHHKKISDELQATMLFDVATHNMRAQTTSSKRKYTASEKATQMREFIKENVSNERYAQDLAAGVGLSDVKASNLPRSLLRAYIAYRWKHDVSN